KANALLCSVMVGLYHHHQVEHSIAESAGAAQAATFIDQLPIAPIPRSPAIRRGTSHQLSATEYPN
ncbi:MAG: hypothetical protein ACRC8I_12370, partial [Plesiomonas shigelloides]